MTVVQNLEASLKVLDERRTALQNKLATLRAQEPKPEPSEVAQAEKLEKEIEGVEHENGSLESEIVQQETTNAQL